MTFFKSYLADEFLQIMTEAYQLPFAFVLNVQHYFFPYSSKGSIASRSILDSSNALTVLL